MTALADEMRVVVVRSTEQGCEPLCTEWISAEGEITSKTDDRFREVFRRLGKRRLPVVISSPGGDVNAAMAIGRMIRERRTDVIVAQTAFWGCEPAQKNCTYNKGRGADYFSFLVASSAFCNSACPLVLAGGVHRNAEAGTLIGVHQVTSVYTKTRTLYQTEYKIVRGKKKVVNKKVIKREKAGSHTVTEMSPALEKQLRSYLKSMNVAPELVDRMKAVKASDIGYLSFDVLRSTKLLDGRRPATRMLHSSACESSPAASFCRLVTTDDV